jgi:hypothetical protein
MVLLAALACKGGEGRAPAQAPERTKEEKNRAQADAELLGREVLEIVDRVMSYRSSHQGKLPASLRQAGLDSLAPLFIRRLGRQGTDPLVMIVFRNAEGHVLSSCQGTNAVLEDQSLRGGSFDVSCTFLGDGSDSFTIPPPEPPKKK